MHLYTWFVCKKIEKNIDPRTQLKTQSSPVSQWWETGGHEQIIPSPRSTAVSVEGKNPGTLHPLCFQAEMLWKLTHFFQND